jgi:WD40 repeat protein
MHKFFALICLIAVFSAKPTHGQQNQTNTTEARGAYSLAKDDIHHGKEVYSLSLSADGKTLAVVDEDKLLTLWDLQTKKATRFPRTGLHHLEVLFQGGGKSLVTASKGGIFLFESGQKKPHWTVSIDLKRGLLAVSPQGNAVAAVAGNRVHMFSGKGEKGEVIDPGLPPVDLAFSPDGKILAIAVDGNSPGEPIKDETTEADAKVEFAVQLWDWAAGKRVQTIRPRSGGARGVDFSPDGSTLLTGGYQLELWALADGKFILAIENTEVSRHAGFTPDGLLVTPDNRRFYSRKTKEKMFCIGDERFSMWGAFDRNGFFYTILTSDRSLVQKWRLADESPKPDKSSQIRVFPLAKNACDLAVSPSGVRFSALNTEMNMISVWDTRDLTHKTFTPPAACERNIKPTPCQFYSHAFLSEKTVLVTLSNHSIQRLDIASGTWTTEGKILTHGEYLATDRNRKVFAFANNDEVTLFFPQKKKKKSIRWVSYSGLKDSEDLMITGIAMFPNGNQLVVLATNGNYRSFLFWDLRHSRWKRKVIKKGGEVEQFEISRDGKTMMIASDPEGNTFWDARRVKRLRQYVSDATRVYGTDITPDGHRAILRGGVLVDWRKGAEIARFTQPHPHKMLDRKFILNGRALVTAHEGAGLRMWVLP